MQGPVITVLKVMLQIFLTCIFLHSGRIKHVNNIPWFLTLNKECKLKILGFISLGSRGWGMTLTSHFHLVWMCGAIPLLPQEEFYLYYVLDITLSIAGWENQIFKREIYFLCLVLYQEPFFGKLFFIYMYLISVAYRGGGLGRSNPPPRNSEGPPKSCQTQPNCKNC